MKHRRVATLTLLAALTALAVAYFAQDVMQLAPCPLCLLERWPYRIAAVLAVLALMARPAGARVLLAMAAIVMFGDILIAGVHVGVESGWWPSPLPECNAMLVPGAPLPMVPAIPCDRPVMLIPHVPISMALMDFCYALVFTLLLLSHVMRKPRRFK